MRTPLQRLRLLYSTLLACALPPAPQGLCGAIFVVLALLLAAIISAHARPHPLGVRDCAALQASPVLGRRVLLRRRVRLERVLQPV